MREDSGDAAIDGEKGEGQGSVVNEARIEMDGGAGADARIEPLRAENEQLRQMMKIRDAKDEMTDALRAAGARSPGLLFAYAVDDLQFDEQGRVANSAALVEKLRGSFPEQFGRDAVPRIDAGAGGGAQTNYLTKEILAKMKPAEIAKLDWAEVRRVLSEKQGPNRR